MYNKILDKGKQLSGIKKTLFLWAINMGLKYEPNTTYSLWYHYKLHVARKLIFSKWKRALGGEIKMILSGGSAIKFSFSSNILGCRY